MKRFGWIFFLPYFVNISTTVIYDVNDHPREEIRHFDVGGYACPDLGACQDLVYILNEGHMKRLENELPDHKIGFSVDDQEANPEKQIKRSDCGPDDCGAEPK